MTFHFAVANHAEYTSAIGEGRAPRVRLVQEWLGQRLETLPRVGSGKENRLLPHCTERTTALSAVRDWQSVFSAFGFTLKVLPSGCLRHGRHLWPRGRASRPTRAHLRTQLGAPRRRCRGW